MKIVKWVSDLELHPTQERALMDIAQRLYSNYTADEIIDMLARLYMILNIAELEDPEDEL
jgi:hypothetical protein